MFDSGELFLCELSELQDPGSKGVTVSSGDLRLELAVVRHGEQVRAYLNSCPHTGGPLDWVPDQFLGSDPQYIQCATHAALFRWQDGVCVAGPCTGEALVAVPVSVVGGQVMLQRAQLPGSAAI